MKKIKLCLNEKSVDEKITQGTSIKNGIAANSATYVNPSPSVAAMNTVITTLQTKQAARVAAVEAAKAATEDLHAAEAAYDLTMVQVATYAEFITGGDPVKLELANLEVRRLPAPTTELGQVENLKVGTNGYPGRYLLSWHPLKGARLYEVQLSVDPPTATSWQTAEGVSAARLRIDGLPSGERRAVRVRGRVKGVLGQWSEPVTRVVP